MLNSDTIDGGAGNDHLPRGVVVGHPHVVLGPLTSGFGVIVGDAEHGRHGPGLLVGGELHGVTAFHHQPGAVGEGEGT